MPVIKPFEEKANEEEKPVEKVEEVAPVEEKASEVKPEEKPVENIIDVVPSEVKDTTPEEKPETKIETIETTNTALDEEEPQTPKKLILIIVVVALAAFALGAIAGGLFMYRQNAVAVPKEITIPKNSEPSSTPVPTTAPVDLTKYKIEVLNGSDTKGAAGTLKDDLTTAGFNVASLGNATSSAFIKTVLSTKKEIDKDYFAKLQEFLQKSHALSVNQDLKEDSKTDILIIIGAE